MKAIKQFIFKDNVAAVICALPFIIGFIVFLVVPMLISLYYSFTDFTLLNNPSFVGLRNYTRMLDDARLWRSFKATFYFAFTSVPLRLIFALAVAMLLLKASRMVGIYRAMYYLPSLLGGSVAVSILWRRMFFVDGTINSLLGLVGLNRNFNWLGNTSTAIWTLILLAVWQFGSSMLIFLASLKQIPETLYEAASIDGSSKSRTFFRITLPLLTPTIFFNLVMQMINGFLTFTPAFIITRTGAPADTTLVYTLYMYRMNFEFSSAGYAAAMAWVMLAIIAFFTFILFITKRFWVYEGGYS
ncbi:MAG: sugar ABC transporter permease [Defluviitaleaceae bacterium]|nr:sugar ABC transporter permease [Defluviitaleaceae bacterium]MCL2836707.1 sugar ABC transporter permease [Defluviitaleaceae bacterium]